MKGHRTFWILLSTWAMLSAFACAPRPQGSSLLLRDLDGPLPQAIQEAFAKGGKSDYYLLEDEGYSFRLIYLCENRIYNFIEEPVKNPVLVSMQPVLDTSVEQRLSADDRSRIWSCMERKVREEVSRAEELKRRMLAAKARLEKELESALAEKERLIQEIEKAGKRKQLEATRQRRLEEEVRKTEEERTRRLDEEQRRKAEEERKIRAYRYGEREKEKEGFSAPPLRVTESGIFLVMKEMAIREEPRENSKIQGRAQKYDLFEVINTRVDDRGGKWHQILLQERVVAEKGKRYGWSPEERSFWVKNRLQAWVYPGDLSRINSAKPLRINVDDIQFTGKKASTPLKPNLFEVSFEVHVEYTERVFGWLDEKNGIRRPDKNRDEMRNLLKELSKSLWPLRIQNEILRGYIRPGFNPEQVVLSWGKPDHVNTTRTLVGIHEQWVYGESPFPNAYVYFENGVVKSWEFLRKGGK